MVILGQRGKNEGAPQIRLRFVPAVQFQITQAEIEYGTGVCGVSRGNSRNNSPRRLNPRLIIHVTQVEVRVPHVGVRLNQPQVDLAGAGVISCSAKVLA